jgi:hypothetical protein
MIALPAVDLRETGGPLRKELQIHVDVALQKDAQNRLADRTALDAILKEHALRSLGEASSVGNVAKLVGADRVLIGLISYEKGMVFRLNLLAVDAESTEVLAAVGRSFKTLKDTGDEAEKAIGELLASMGRTSPLIAAGSEQRLREAQLYLAAAEADGQAFSLSGNLALLEHAEMAYLLARDHPQVVEKVAAKLCDCAVMAPDMARDLRLEVVKIVEKMIGAQNDAAAGGPDLLIWRAYVCYKAESFSQGVQLMHTLARAYPDKFDDEAKWVCAECLEAEGQAREALACIASCRPSCRVLKTRAKAYRRINDNAEEFAALERLPANQMGDLLPRFIDLLASRKGAQAAVEYINHCMRDDHWLSAHADIELQLAQYTLAAGDKKSAAAICQRLWDVGESNVWSWKGVGDSRVFKKRLEEVRAQTGASEERWLKACEVQPFPARHALYIQPLGAVDMKLIEQVRASVQVFFGARTEILTQLELSKNEPSFDKESCKYDATRLLPDTFRKLRVPSDALAVAIITKENLCTPDLMWIYSRQDKQGILCSYFVWAQKPLSDRATCLRNAVIGNISGMLGLHGRFPCITASTGDAGSSLLMKFAFCPEVQARYKALDLVAEQRKSIKLFESAGAVIVQKW